MPVNNSVRREWLRPSTGLVLAVCVLSVAAPLQAQTRPIDLGVATLEDLMNIEITSASRKSERAEDVPAAVYVITRDDIRRSGMTTVPELLRLAPGVQVAQINANKWAISIRGFSGISSNKVVVLVDGRSLYNPLFASVLWDTEDLMLEDVERIEVIRGAGGTVWGANAVNGVINIITRPASETTGVVARAGAGTFDRASAAVRFGGTAGPGAYRTYAQLSMHGDSVLSPQTAAGDHWRSVTSGFRGDWSIGPEAFMLQGSVAAGQERPLWIDLDPAIAPDARTAGVSGTQVADVLGRWTHTRANGATLQLQSFVDVAHRREAIGVYSRQTMDFDVVYHTVVGRRHDLVAGGGYRYIREAMDGGAGYSFTPDRAQEHLVNAFAQDDIALGRRLQLTLGTKFEQDSGLGFNLQPTARLMWRVTPAQHLWTSVSRAVRTPSLVERGVHIEFPPVLRPAQPGDAAPAFPIAISVNGNPLLRDEDFVSTEAGYRLDVGSRAAIDVTGFVGRYQNLQTNESSAPALTFPGGRPVIAISTKTQNLLDAETRGAEITARVTLSPAWQLDTTFSAFHLTPHPDAASHDPVAATIDGDAPAYQWRGHSTLALGPHAQADVLLFYVGRLGRLAVPAYTRADLRFEWKMTPRVSAIVQGQNLLSPSHLEFADTSGTILATMVPRSAGVRLTRRY